MLVSNYITIPNANNSQTNSPIVMKAYKLMCLHTVIQALQVRERMIMFLVRFVCCGL